MKKLFALVLCLALLMCAFASAEEISGGWEMTDIAQAIPQEALDAFQKAFEGFCGVGYEPVALLSRQVVAGMNYCFLCKAVTVTAQPEHYWAYVYIYADLQGNAQITKIEAITPDVPEVEETAAYEYTAGDEPQYISDMVFDGDVAVRGVGQAVYFMNCVFNGNVISYAPSTTYVWIMDDCVFNGDAHCILKSGVREADTEYPIPKFALLQPVPVECEDLGGALAAGTFDIVLNGQTFSIQDIQYMDTGDGNVVPYEPGMEAGGHVAMHWWENGEEIIFTAGGN